MSTTRSAKGGRHMIRLSKRMSELNLCSRREADKYIQEGLVSVRGVPVQAMLGQKVCSREEDIKIMLDNASEHSSLSVNSFFPQVVVLNKPLGYVSGQPELLRRQGKEGNRYKYEPAVSLLNRSNFFAGKLSEKINVRALDFDGPRGTLSGFVPAGRLDVNSTGLLVFTKSGIVAKQIISKNTSIPKEYIVGVKDVSGRSRHLNDDIDLSVLLGSDNSIKDENRGYVPIKPLLEAKWLNEKQIRFVLLEGKKRMIRKICRQHFDLEVTALKRTKIGQFPLDSLPTGKWRPLIEEEVQALLHF